jgi:hypothetical protein
MQNLRHLTRRLPKGLGLTAEQQLEAVHVVVFVALGLYLLSGG